jgi:hypothetical protein
MEEKEKRKDSKAKISEDEEKIPKGVQLRGKGSLTK